MDVGTYLRVMPPKKKSFKQSNISNCVGHLILDFGIFNLNFSGKSETKNEHTSFFPRPFPWTWGFFSSIHCQATTAPPPPRPCSDWDSKSRMGKWLPADSASLRMRYLGQVRLGVENGLPELESPTKKRWDSEKKLLPFLKKPVFFLGGGGKE